MLADNNCHWYCFSLFLITSADLRRRLCFWCGLFVCMFVCLSVCLFVCLFVSLSVGLLANLWTDYDEIFWRGRAWLKDQVKQFWWRSGSRFGSGSPKSEIRILRIGGGLYSLSISSSFCVADCINYNILYIVISVSSLHATASTKIEHPLVQNIIIQYNEILKQNHTVILCWIPSHISILGNTWADKTAKSALS